MSSLSTLKQELQEADELLRELVGIQVVKEEELQDAVAKVEVVKKHYAKIRRALYILEGGNEATITEYGPTVPAKAPVELVVTQAVPVPQSPPVSRPSPVYAISCTACPGQMQEMVRATRGGPIIRYMQCNKCSNEAY